MAKNKSNVPKKMVPAKSDGRVEESHVQPAPSGAAPPPQQAGAPGFRSAMVETLEGANERLDLLGEVGMNFGDLNRGVPPADPAVWMPTSQ
jgi:hypothetical protein